MEMEQVALVNGLEIKYRFKAKKYDCNSLIVVFSGFGASGNFTYDFINVLKEIYANVLWIKDDFSGNVAYYYAVKGEEIHSKINQFILDIAAKNNVKKENIILSGFSKGGSAALYYALKYDYEKIISTVPQLKLDTYCKEKHLDVLEHILGKDYTEQKYNELNDAILSLLSLSDKNKNIYLLTSKADEQYEDQIKPFIEDFYKFSNFNLFYSGSILVRTHNQVTSHHVQLILSWYYSLINNLTPYYGIKKIKGEEIKTKEVDVHECYVELRKFELKEFKIFPEGVGLVENYNCENWSDVDYTLLFKGNHRDFQINIAKGHKPQLTREFYNGFFTIYDKCWFASYKYQGVDLSHLEKGSYKLFLEINLKKINKIVYKEVTSKFEKIIENEFLKVYFGSKNTMIEIK